MRKEAKKSFLHFSTNDSCGHLRKQRDIAMDRGIQFSGVKYPHQVLSGHMIGSRICHFRCENSETENGPVGCPSSAPHWLPLYPSPSLPRGMYTYAPGLVVSYCYLFPSPPTTSLLNFLIFDLFFSIHFIIIYRAFPWSLTVVFIEHDTIKTFAYFFPADISLSISNFSGGVVLKKFSVRTI